MEASKAMRSMIAARAALVLDKRFWGMLALKLKLVEDPTCDTAWTDGRSLGFNPEYVLSLTPSERKTLWGHEVAHNAYGHPWRRGGRNPDKWNDAGDMAINDVLRRDQFDMPDNILYPDPMFPVGKSAEWYCNRMPDPPQRGNGGGGEPDEDETGDEQQEGQGEGTDDGDPGDEQPQDGDGGDGGDDTDGDQQGGDETDDSADGNGSGDDQQQDDSSGDGGSSDDQQPGDGSGAGDDSAGDGTGDEQDDSKPRPFGGEVRDAPTEVDEEGDEPPSQEDWQQAVQQAAAVCEGIGKLPGGAERVVDDARAPYVDWRSVTLRFAQEAQRTDFTWSRPNPRYIHMGLYLPALHDPGMGALVVAVDTSGSIDRTLLSIFGATFQDVVDTVKPRCVYIVYCDTAIQHVDKFEQGDPIEVNHRGGGGTSFHPVFDGLASQRFVTRRGDTVELDDTPACCIYLTDLDVISFPASDAGVPTLWCTPQRHAAKEVPFGEIVPIEE